MAKTSTEVKTRYNRKTYKRYEITVRKDSALYEKIEEYRRLGKSLNAMVIKLLDENL